MIISASRRTDIPAFYSEWLINRLKAGDALIPNPRNANRLASVRLSPETVDCIVFWTKNPIPMLDKLQQLDAMGYCHYTQFTLTPYDNTVEVCLPSKQELIEAFIELSRRTSPARVVWRYDPIMIDAQHSVAWHSARFAELCGKLHNYTERCIVSFIDPYKHMRRRFTAMTHREINAIAARFMEIAQPYGIPLYTCAEEIELAQYGMRHSACIDKALIEQIIGSRITAKRDANQRTACRCIESVDIGAYDTCPHGCVYCYATSNPTTVIRRVAGHDPSAPMLTGCPKGSEMITDRTAPSQKINQMSIF